MTYFTPLYDADGNAVLIRTSTGVWQISYNGENRPVRFENTATETVITCAYDSQVRRFEKKVSVAGTHFKNKRFGHERQRMPLLPFSHLKTDELRLSGLRG